MTVLLYLAAIVLAYLLGSIPFGLVIARIVCKQDVRKVGSGKIGMTNVMRAAGKKAAAVSLLLDVVKGVLAVVFAGLIVGDNGPYLAQLLAGLAAIGGHTWSVFLGFKGGRGVATFFGGLAALYWPAALLGGLCVLGLGFRTRYMSLGSITGSVVAFVYMAVMTIVELDFLMASPPYEFLIYSLVGAIFIYVMHRDNIHRLMNGTERKIGEKSPPGPEPSASSLK